MVGLKRFRRLIPVAYLFWAIPFLITLSWLTPPWQSPDEPAQFIRADQVAHGEIIGTRTGALMAGGFSDPQILDSFRALNDLPFKSGTKVDETMLEHTNAFTWGPRSFVLNPNTAQYPPFFYLTPAMAVRVGQLYGLSIVHTLYLARVACLLVTSFISALAFMFSRRTTAFLMIVAMLPMNVSLSASISQDGQILSCTLLAISLLDRLITEEREASRFEGVAIVGLLALVGMARPPYLSISVLSLLITRKIRLRALASTGVTILIVLSWVVLSAMLTTVPMAGSNLMGQLRFGLMQPQEVWAAFQNTFVHSSKELVLETIGKLGWLDTSIGTQSYVFIMVLLTLGFITMVGGQSRRSGIALVIILLTGVCIAGAQYLTWTAVGCPFISGLQGRYFEVPLAASSMCVPGFRKLGAFTDFLGAACVVLMGATVPLIVIKALVVRFYLV